MDQSIIELTSLTKKYGSFTAVDDLNLTIKKGEIFGLLGPNGAGKSTTILMMLGLTEPTSGSVSVCGINSTTNPIEVKRKVGYLPEDVGFYDNYTGFENLLYTARLNSMSLSTAKKEADQLLEKVGLTNEKEKKAGKYSRGMRQRLGLADVLIKKPEVIILDEPTLGIDPKGVEEFLELILSLSREEGRTVLLSSHHLHQVQEICDRIGLFVGGRLIAEGDIKSLSQKLFSEELIKIEAGINKDLQIKADADPGEAVTDILVNSLKAVTGVINVDPVGNVLHIGCSHDVTEEIVETIVRSGTGIRYLNKKEYGLNDIYNRYFEGVESHEQHIR
ncbi:MAG: ABC transporter ATP-binding protein [Bacteroidales bacterium]|nr:ABC transporter ATP-binding protein [Bacteroidales bacterium]